jgi:hypothetical protein
LSLHQGRNQGSSRKQQQKDDEFFHGVLDFVQNSHRGFKPSLQLR